VELRLGPVFLLEGVVVDAAGAPVAKARVSAQREGFSYSISTGADGRFSAGLRSAGTYVVTAARRNGAATQPLRVEVPGTEGLKLVVGEELVLRGSVVGPNGEARAGVLVQAISSSFPTLMIAKHVPQQQPLDPAALVPYARQTGQYLEATSTADGSFSLPMGGEALVFAQVGQELSEPVEGSPTAPVRLVLSPRARATGRVLDWNRRPVPGFSINSTRFNSAEGRFELPLPARGSVSLRIEAPLAPSETRAVEVPATPGEVPLGDILLKRGFTVVGRVLDARTHKPIGTPVTLGAKSDGGALDGTAVQGDGTFVLKRVPAGKLALNVGASGYAPKAITLEVKEGLREQLLELEKAASLELKVLRAGEPAAGVNVEVIGPDALPGQPENRRTGGTSSDGTWKREQLAAGAWTVKVGRPTSTVRTVVLKPGQQGTLELSIP
jgi:hypothetical protein